MRKAADATFYRFKLSHDDSHIWRCCCRYTAVATPLSMGVNL